MRPGKRALPSGAVHSLADLYLRYHTLQLLSALLEHNCSMVQGVVLVTATVYILLNLLADVLYVLVNPRLRT